MGKIITDLSFQLLIVNTLEDSHLHFLITKSIDHQITLTWINYSVSACN